MLHLDVQVRERRTQVAEEVTVSLRTRPLAGCWVVVDRVGCDEVVQDEQA